jgi:flagellar biosynthesis protein FlhB
MADPSEEDRSHEPTARRVAKARAEGRVAVSRDLSAGFTILIVWAAFAVGGRAALGGLAVSLRDTLDPSGRAPSVRAAIGDGASAALSALALPVLALLAAAITIGLAQTRGLFRAGPLGPDARRIAPHLGRLWGADKLGFAGKELGRIALLLLVAAVSVASSARGILGLAGADAGRILDAVFVTARDLGLALALAMLGLGVADYLWQLFRHRKLLRMTQDEVKREHKETEGDPVFKSERRRIHWGLLQAHALAELSPADLVVVEPGRVAVALRYAAGAAEAPFVMAKGRNRMAERMESVAAEAGAPIVVARALAERLAATDEGEEIPEDLYEAVAELLVQTGIHRRQDTSGNQGEADPSGID